MCDVIGYKYIYKGTRSNTIELIEGRIFTKSAANPTKFRSFKLFHIFTKSGNL